MTVIYIFILAQPLTSASNLYSQFQMALGAAERIFELLNQPVAIADLPAISFEAKAGQVVALVGPSGAGKTTIANLIPRFFDVESGRIMLDGYVISQVQLQSLRGQIGIVLQEPVLFSATIRENIAYGREEATLEEIEMVAQAANARLDHLMQGRTTLVIAHRLSTIQNADKIVVLEEGRVIEQGRHEELLALQGKYHRLYTRTFQEQVEVME